MLSPTKFSNGCCRSQINQWKDADGSESDILVANIVDGFEMSPSYEVVYKNYDMTKPLKSWISEGNKKDKIVGFKDFISYPYEDIKFKVGDFVSWRYRKGDPNLSVWLIESFDEQQYFNARGRILECNQKVKWRKSDKTVESVDCVLMDSMTYVNFLGQGKDGLVEPNGSIVIMTQNNATTNYIQKNRRFIFGENVYMVKQTFRAVNNNFLRVFLSEVPQQDEDDFVNQIAWNGEEQPIVTDNKTVILPTVDSILLYDIMALNIYKYVGNDKQLDTFTITATGVPQDCFTLTIVDGNNFTIENLKEYKNNVLTISCKNNVDNTVTTKEVWLRGRWG